MITILEIKTNYDILVIPCSSVKQPHINRADQFYCGSHFRRQLKVAHLTEIPFYILSTYYGLIPVDHLCEPYNLIWSEGVKHDNKAVRNLDIPIATEGQRLKVARQATEILGDKKVFSFCSLHYKKYFSNWFYFNEIVAKNQPRNNVGIQFLTHALSKLGSEL